MRHTLFGRSSAFLAWAALLGAAGVLESARALAEDAKPAKKDSRASVRPKEATFTTTVTPAEARPGDSVTYKVTAQIDEKWHIYKYAKTANENGPKYTEFDFFDPAGLKIVGDWKADRPPIKKKEAVFPDLPFLEYHEEEVIWSIELKVPADAKPGKKVLKCQAGYMICSDQNCSFPGQWTLPDAELTIVAGPKRIDIQDEAIVASLVGLVPQAPSADTPKPEKKDSRAASRPKDTTFKTEVVPAEARPGSTVTLKVTATVTAPAHIYKYSPVQPDDGPNLTNFDLFDPAGLVPKGDWTANREPTKRKEPAFPNIEFVEFYEGEVTWSHALEVPADAKPGKKSVRVQIAFMTCTDKNCSIPGQWTLPAAEMTVLEGPAVASVSPEQPKSGGSVAPVAGSNGSNADEKVHANEPAKGIASAPLPGDSSDINSKLQEGIIPFLLACAGGGLFALAMPCVWPMIPVTVNFFVKQGQKKQGKPTSLAIAYCLSIIGTFMGIGFLFSIFFGAASLSKLANNPWLNFGIAGLFLVFGLSLLGLFEIRLPNFLLNASAQGESKGGMVGVMFMALTLTITSFTCTFPVVGGLLVMAAGGKYFYPVIGLATFAAVVALPFFLLALSPGLLNKMPKSGDWMNTVKVVGGMIEIGAAFKFINTAECIFVVPSEAWFNAYTVLTIWVVMALICGIYLLGLFRTDHDYEEVKVGPGRIIFGWVFLALALFLAPALFGRPPQSKVWYLVVGLLPADAGDLKAPTGSGGSGEALAQGATSTDPKQAEREQTAFHGVAWGMSYDAALEKSKAQGKPVLIDFTGVNCANCRLMEQEVLPRPEVAKVLSQFITIQLYTDTVPIKSLSKETRLELGEQNLDRALKLTNEATNPNYVIVDAEGNVLGKRGGKIPAEQFIGFMNDGLSKFKNGQGTAKGDGVVAPGKSAEAVDPKKILRQETTFAGVPWGFSYEAAIERARVEKKPVLLYFTGVNDANSRVMEVEVFPRREVAEALSRFVPLRLDLDTVPVKSLDKQQRLALAEENLDFKLKLTNDVATPSFAILNADGKLVSRIAGKVPPEAMVDFLTKR